ncbi:hypothetical protein GGTG_06676 [Gaeumannomyces tritici R3-111a-1]|uniref:Uncharacterized protein n=1 Tax=Gaeumannomyces tritici (strain R3-111a-1) TaxID=644352 RepID=J3NZH8_GAET3|nr:hypothetical protein GGTG_06676 [Gaeumannomyces tritici R3-111a-1]EJT76761.1 hypothetical protein GGTG_06676 [Gaeumannomyces tritici R3-111a-1]
MYFQQRKVGPERYKPCPRLCHGEECLKPPGECQLSHDGRVIAAFKAGRGRQRCDKGEDCWNAANYLCRYQHTLDEVFPEGPRLAKAMEDLDEISSINMGALSSQEDTHISDLKGLSSFSTLDKDDEVAIPGTPAFFNTPSTPIAIISDNKNGVLPELPKRTHSFDALVTSIEMMTDGSALRSSDVVASCGALRMILNFMRRSYQQPGTEMEKNPLDLNWLPHRFDLQWREPGTLYISPWANDPRFKRSWGKGRGFESETRKFDQSHPVLSRSSSHHQVVSYNLGGLRCVVQAEVDAYSCDCGHQSGGRPQEGPPHEPFELVRPRSAKSGSARRTSTPSPVIRPVASSNTGRGKGKGRRPGGRRSVPIIDFSLLNIDDAGDSESQSSLRSGPPSTPGSAAGQASRNSKLTVRKAGNTQPPIPISCLLEIKTRKEDSTITIESWAAQLYFSGRRQVFEAMHRHGVFHPRDGGTVPDLDGKLENWASRDSIQAALSRTVALLRAIRNKLAQLEESGDISLGPEGNGLSLLLGEDEEGNEGGGRVPFARLYMRNDGVRLVP